MTTFQIADHFGAFCAGGEEACEFLVTQVAPIVDESPELHFDFTGVRNMNSSFANALFANLIAGHGESILKKLRFRSANATVQVQLRAAMCLGLERSRKPASAT